MRSFVLLAISLGVVISGCSGGPAPFDQAQKNAIRLEVEETLVGLTEAMNAHQSDRILAYYRESEEFLYLGCTDYLIGWGTFSSRARAFHLANPEVTFHQELVHIQVLSPTVAVASQKGGSSDAEALFWTEVLVLGDTGWKIVYEHESWPGCSPPSGAHPFTTPGEMSDLDFPPDTIG